MIRRWSITLACLAVPLAGWLLLRMYPIAVGFSTPHFSGPAMIHIPEIPVDPSLRPHQQISITYQFLSVDVSEMKDFLDQVGTAMGEPMDWPSQVSKPILLSDTMATAIRKLLQNGRSVTGPRVALGDGQTGFVVIGTDQAYVLNAQNRQGGRTTFEPEIETMHTGVRVLLRPKIAESGSSVRLHTMLQAPRLLALAKVPFPDAPPGTDLIIDRPKASSLEILDQTIVIPDGQTALLLLRQPSALWESGDIVAVMVKTTIHPPGTPPLGVQFPTTRPGPQFP